MDGRDFSWVALVGALALLGCTSDEETICQRLSACDLLGEDYSQAKCEADAGVHVDDERLGRCAECVTSEPCDELQDTCREHCEPVY